MNEKIYNNCCGRKRYPHGWRDAQTVSIIGWPSYSDAYYRKFVCSRFIAADYFGASFEKFKPDILVKENDQLEIGSKKFRVLETPGHSLGGVCYICDEEKFLFSGDTLFKLTVGRTDLWGGNLNELLDSVEKLMLLSDDYIVYTGHNISTTIGSERVRNRYLRKKRT